MNASRDFLVEIGTEELPPKSLLNLSAAFAEGVAKGLKDTGVAYKSLEAFATPRRLAVRVRKLIEQQPDRPLEKRGPPVKAAFDANGAPTQAALAFARGCGVEVSALAAELGWSRKHLSTRFREQVGLPPARVRVCRGRLFSPRDYVTDITEWGFADVVGKGLEERHEPIA